MESKESRYSLLQGFKSDFLRNGYCKVEFSDISKLLSIKNLVQLSIESSIEAVATIDKPITLEDLHTILNRQNINADRLHAIEQLQRTGDFNRALYLDPLPDLFQSLIGHDILIQKHVNLVIQRPGDADNSELHRDAPANSEFEIVVWVPFVDCSSDMSLFILNLESTANCLSELRKSSGSNWPQVKAKIENEAVPIPVNFGEALIFMTPLYHGSKVNTGLSTRVSTNFRVRSMFAPSGLKDSLNFWEILVISPFTKNVCQFF
jgi:sporadic carbohydrate cluster 2OG-Fe(II) oxygenase